MNHDHPAAPAIYRVGLVKGIGSMSLEAGGVEAIVFDLPGCQCSGPDESAVRSLLPVVIAEHLAWLDQHGDVTRDAFPFAIEVVEAVDIAEMAEVAAGEFCFEDDLRPATAGAVETAMRRMAFARQDLLDIVRPLPDAVLDWEPPVEAMGKVDEWARDVRSIRGVLNHIASAEGYYARNIGSDRGAPQSEADRFDLFGQRQRALVRLRGLTEGELAAEYKHRQPWQESGYEHWTVRKALRRFIAHERFHTREIEQRLAWLLLGLPLARQDERVGDYVR
jgi:hypothetical protein